MLYEHGCLACCNHGKYLRLSLTQAYANNYTGNAKINRLVFISEKTAAAGLALSALKMAAEDLKKVRVPLRRDNPLLETEHNFHANVHARCSAAVQQGQNTSRYEDVVQRLNNRYGQHYALDR